MTTYIFYPLLIYNRAIARKHTHTHCEMSLVFVYPVIKRIRMRRLGYISHNRVLYMCDVSWLTGHHVRLGEYLHLTGSPLMEHCMRDEATRGQHHLSFSLVCLIRPNISVDYLHATEPRSSFNFYKIDVITLSAISYTYYGKIDRTHTAIKHIISMATTMEYRELLPRQSNILWDRCTKSKTNISAGKHLRHYMLFFKAWEHI